MACNECDGNGIGHSLSCAVSLYEKLDAIKELLFNILIELRRSHKS